MKENKNTKEKMVNAEGRTLGRVASEVAFLLMGKGKVSYQRHIYEGSNVRVVNTSKLKITVKKLKEIYHTRYSGHRGGLRVLTGAETVSKKGQKELIRLSIYGMLPGNKLRRKMMKNLKIED